MSRLLAREGPLDEERSLAIVLPIVDGLQQVHAAGYLHRDIKPGNIVLGADGAPVLLDFGAARQSLGDRTRSLTAIVSDGYAPIEQYARDSRQGPWTDIYALGAVLYRCLTNRQVPEAPARADADELVPAREAPPYRLSPALRDALDAALAVRAADRPPTLAVWQRMFSRSPHASVERPGTPGRSDGIAPAADGAAAAALAGRAELSRQRQRLVDWVRRQLIGPAGSGWLPGSPLERYPTGVLHPVDPGGSGSTGLDPAQLERDPAGPHLDPAPQGLDSQAADVPGSAAVPPDDEEDDSPVAADGTPAGITARPVGRRRYVPPCSVGVSFYVRGDARLRVTASAASYRRVRERDESGRFVAHPPVADPEGGDGGSPDDGNVARARYERTPFECGLVWPGADGETPEGMRREVRRRPYRDGDVLRAVIDTTLPTGAMAHARDSGARARVRGNVVSVTVLSATFSDLRPGHLAGVGTHRNQPVGTASRRTSPAVRGGAHSDRGLREPPA